LTIAEQCEKLIIKDGHLVVSILNTKKIYSINETAKFLEHEHFFSSNFNFRAILLSKKKGTSTNFFLLRFKYKDTTHARIHSCFTKLVSCYVYIVYISLFIYKLCITKFNIINEIKKTKTNVFFSSAFSFFASYKAMIDLAK
jgi:hypothetical protein